MRSEIFNTTFENMLRVLVLLNTLSVPRNKDRIAALDFICIYGKNCKVLDKNLHGDNEFGFAEFAGKREKITEAIKLSVKNNFVNVIQDRNGFLYSINDRGKVVVNDVQSPYSKAYTVGAKIVNRRFSTCTDQDILKFISDKASKSRRAGDAEI